ncbi:translation initiation factor eIF-2B subunit beta-like [Limulus polyphemus]|uniref:Translation initiation factor eIF2B subunit beta n=1 Tax=Limulus polyphemus TaxID=6850 RepID=A0ABM1BTF2_LIMPO|nr:translation initiation factor eIF-2B subunit beta-like [Limulus polyphemus]XP_022256553.1 translation initiation factor eIF-2B subunit beta-like [Limulus polyphemus]
MENVEMEKFIHTLKYGKLSGSCKIAQLALQVLENHVISSMWLTAYDLLTSLKVVGKSMIDAQPTENAVGNVVRRVLKIVRDEYASALGKHAEGDPQESLQKMFQAKGRDDNYRKELPALKEAIVDSLEELKRELETSKDNIAEKSLEHIHSDEVIMTIGQSMIVKTFLKYAACRKRLFQVIVVETPSLSGHLLAKNLAESGIETTVITDAAVFAIMSRVNKVIVGTHSIMANGGLKAISGAHTLALAAKRQSVPFIVCAPIFKLTPQYLCHYDQDAFNKFGSPQEVTGLGGGEVFGKAQIINPVFDYVPPELVTLFISNIGGNAPSYMYRLLSELYHPDDYEL